MSNLLCFLWLSVSENVLGGQSDGIPAPQKILFPGNKLTLKWERVYRVGAGLHNLGNTCFLNSTVQCLTYTPPLANYLLSKEHSRACKYWNKATKCCYISPHIRSLLTSVFINITHTYVFLSSDNDSKLISCCYPMCRYKQLNVAVECKLKQLRMP